MRSLTPHIPTSGPSGALNIGGWPGKPLREIYGLRAFEDGYQGGGLRHGRIVESLVRYADQSAPLLVHIWPRFSKTSEMWRWFFERPDLMRDPACPLLPAVRIIEHGHSTSIVTHSPPRSLHFDVESTANGHVYLNMRRRLERVRDAFQALAWLHAQGVSLNFIDSFEETFVPSYAQRAGPEHLKRTVPGCPERFACTEVLPSQPAMPFPHGPRHGPSGLPWSAATAMEEARVAGPRLVSSLHRPQPDLEQNLTLGRTALTLSGFTISHMQRTTTKRRCSRISKAGSAKSIALVTGRVTTSIIAVLEQRQK